MSSNHTKILASNATAKDKTNKKIKNETLLEIERQTTA